MSTAISLEEFHRRYDGVKPYYEYWFGEAIQKPRANCLHSGTQFATAMLLHACGWASALEVTLKLVPDAEPIPDVIAMRQEFAREPYPTKPVDLCVEILSPEDRPEKIIEKGRYYLKWGVPNVWIIDPADGDLVADDTEIGLPEIFAEAERMLI